MGVLTKEGINELEKGIKPFDGALRNAMRRNEDIAELLNSMRMHFGVRWNITLYYEADTWRTMEETAPSELIGGVLRNIIDCPDLKKAKEFMEKSPDTCSEYLKKAQDCVEDLADTKEGMEEIIRWVRNVDKDGSSVFFLQSLSVDDKVRFYDIKDTAQKLVAEIGPVLEKTEKHRDFVLDQMIEKANEQTKAVISWLNEHSDAFGMMDLKLHDASFYEYRSLEDEFPGVKALYDGYSGHRTPFDDFCEMSYEEFTEWMKEEGIDWNKMHHQVGRTSSFYLHDEGNGICLSRRDYSIVPDDTLECLVDNLGYQDGVKFLSDGRLDADYFRENFPDTLSNLSYIAEGEFYGDVVKEYEDTIKVYDYIKDFKEHQVEYFKDYLEEKKEFYADEIKAALEEKEGNER